jgi:hypothetical protein
MRLAARKAQNVRGKTAHLSSARQGLANALFWPRNKRQRISIDAGACNACWTTSNDDRGIRWATASRNSAWRRPQIAARRRLGRRQAAIARISPIIPVRYSKCRRPLSAAHRHYSFGLSDSCRAAVSLACRRHHAGLQHAKDMLNCPNENTSVADVAFACSFCNLGHFAKTYCEMFGELPSRALNRSKGEGDFRH